MTNASYSRTGCNGKHYYLGDQPAPREDGWTYFTCSACGAPWRTKTISEELPYGPPTDDHAGVSSQTSEHTTSLVTSENDKGGDA